MLMIPAHGFIAEAFCQKLYANCSTGDFSGILVSIQELYRDPEVLPSNWFSPETDYLIPPILAIGIQTLQEKSRKDWTSDDRRFLSKILELTCGPPVVGGTTETGDIYFNDDAERWLRIFDSTIESLPPSSFDCGLELLTWEYRSAHMTLRAHRIILRHTQRTLRIMESEDSQYKLGSSNHPEDSEFEVKPSNSEDTQHQSSYLNHSEDKESDVQPLESMITLCQWSSSDCHKDEELTIKRPRSEDTLCQWSFIIHGKDTEIRNKPPSESEDTLSISHREGKELGVKPSVSELTLHQPDSANHREDKELEGKASGSEDTLRPSSSVNRREDNKVEGKASVSRDTLRPSSSVNRRENKEDFLRRLEGDGFRFKDTLRLVKLSWPRNRREAPEPWEVRYPKLQAKWASFSWKDLTEEDFRDRVKMGLLGTHSVPRKWADAGFPPDTRFEKRWMYDRPKYQYEIPDPILTDWPCVIMTMVCGSLFVFGIVMLAMHS